MPRDSYEISFAGSYADGSAAFVISKNGEPWMKPTVCLAPGYTPPSDCILIKDWGENEGILASMFAADLIAAPHAEHPAGWAVAYECRMKADLARLIEASNDR